MRQTYLIWVIVSLVTSVAGNTFAGGGLWTGAGATPSWDDADNWENGLPVLGDTTVIRFGEAGDVPLQIGAGVSAKSGLVIMGNLSGVASAGTVTLNVTDGGTLETNGDLNIGRNGGPATLNLNDASSSVTVNASVVIGNDETAGDATGTVNQTAGIFSVSALFVLDASSLGGQSGAGIYNLHGGELKVLSSNILFGAQALLDITHGTMTVVGDRTSRIDTAILDGTITAFGGTGLVFRNFDVASNKTTIWASQVPEPTSAALVGVSGLVLLVCRRLRVRPVA